MQELERSVIRILNAQGTTAGTGFVVTDHYAVTCAHVIQAAGSSCGASIRIQYYHGMSEQIAQVSQEGWSSTSADDIALLQLNGLPEGVTPMTMGTAKECDGHPYISFGFAKLAEFDSRKVSDYIDGVVSVRDNRKQRMLQLKGEEIDKGLSGSPVLDTKTNRVVGMVSEYKDVEQTRFAWATTADSLAPTLATLDPSFRLWPETFGPIELDRYLQFLIDTSQRLRLPDGQEVELERIYVSLRADEMSATEWKAEHNLYLEDVERITQELKSARETADQYTEFDILHKAIVRHPKVLKLTARDWRKLFAAQGQQPLSLAEVVKRHLHVVILGDPGSGKTTLGKWLALHYTRAILQHVSHVQVRADLVQPGAEAETHIGVGEARLPILIRVADYAQARWVKGQSDNELPLENFIGSHENKKNKPAALKPEVIQAIAWDALSRGQAFVILDGLDEVADPEQRRKVMHEVKRFIEHPFPTMMLSPVQTTWANNRVLLTSRIVGYQFDPLTDLPHYTIEEMDEAAIAAFYHAWMRHVPSIDEAEAGEEAGRLVAAVFHHAHLGVRTLAGNPLLSTLLAQVYWSSPQHSLPTSRVALFEQVTRLFYDQREAFWDRAGVPPLRLNRALGSVAAHIHAREPTGFTDEGQICEQLHRVLSDPEQVAAVLEAAREVSGFLVARGEGVYGFLHRSIQEYFVALHLTDPYDDETKRYLIERLQKFSLDPIWREPVSLAVGIVSRRTHPQNRNLGRLLTALLNAPDPASDVLPRREFLAAAACAECERTPPGIGQRIAEQLLGYYAEREGRGRTLVIRERIRQAFRTLQRGPVLATPETEMVLCIATRDADFDRRYAAIDLIIETQWDTPSIASALVDAWRTYPNPAAAPLMALEYIHARHPECFRDIGLPLRQVDAASFWKHVKEHSMWQHIASVLYLPLSSDATPELVNRDSSLTEYLLKVFSGDVNDEVLDRIHYHLLSLIWLPDTVQARDAALALFALGDATWFQGWMTQAQDQEKFLHVLIATLGVFLARTRALARDHVRTLFLTLDYVHDSTLDSDFNLARVQSEFIRDLSHERTQPLNLEAEYAFDPARDYEVDFVRPLDYISDQALIHTLDSELNLARVLTSGYLHISDIERYIQETQKKWGHDIDLIHSLNEALVHLEVIKKLFVFLKLMEPSWNTLMAACNEQQSVNPIQQEPEAQENDQVTLHALEQLTKDLISSDDTRREQARRVLMREQQASILGISVIERIAALAQEHAANPPISSQFEWALQSITHDRPDWIKTWVSQAHDLDHVTPAQTILCNIGYATNEVFETLVQVLLESSYREKSILLRYFSWLIRLDRVPREAWGQLQQELCDWLDQEDDPTQRCTIIHVLGYCQDQQTARVLTERLSERLNKKHALIQEQESTEVYTALARLATHEPWRVQPIEALRVNDDVPPVAASAIARLSLKEVLKREPILLSAGQEGRVNYYRRTGYYQTHGTSLVEKLTSIIPDPASCLDALLEAGMDNDSWIEEYHSILVVAAQMVLENHPDLLRMLFRHLEQALAKQDWTQRRMALAVVAASAEVMPTKLNEVAQGRLESLLVRGTTDARSFNSRRFALTALSYLRTATPAIVPALIAGCQDIEPVQLDAITAAGRFQSVEGDVLTDLFPLLTGESVSTAYAMTQLLSALSTSGAGEIAKLHGQIIEALIQAIKDPGSQRKVVMAGQEKGTLEDALYKALLQVVGWVA